MATSEALVASPEALSAGAKYAAAILTRRRRKCIAEGAHIPQDPDTPGQTRCPRCGL